MIPFCLLAALLSAAPSTAPRRFALVVGENGGDAADARRVQAVLQDVGGVQADDLTLLAGTDAAGFGQALSDLHRRLAAAAGPGNQLVVYVSSHADDHDLHLRGTHFPLAALRDAILRAPADVALLVLDTCQSGSITRVKGLRPMGGVSVAVEATELKGHVIVSSSGPDEYAQESDALGGSYFTYHWATGLRGPADASRDGRVTLQEAYDYAYARTVESTFANPAGAQHPNYSVEMKGQGDLVLSEPVQATSRLIIAVDSPGEWIVASDDASALIGQFQKGRGPATFAIAPGAYRVRTGGYEARVSVVPGAGGTVHSSDLVLRAPEALGLKGSRRPWTFGLAAVGSPSLFSDAPWLAGAEATVRYRTPGWGPFNEWIAIARLASATSAQPQAPTEGRLDLRIGAGHTAQWGRVELSAALMLGLMGVREDNLPSGPRGGVEGFGGGRLEARLSLGDWAPFVFADGGAALVRWDSGRVLTWSGALGAGTYLPL